METKRFITKVIPKAAVCLMATVLSACFTGCSEKNSENIVDPVPSGVPAQLVNTWYGEYSSRGQITQSTANSREGYYVRAVQGLKFNADGTGTCYKYLCDVAGDPLSIYGGEMDDKNGRFHFTVKDDSIINITRDGDGDSQNPKKWTVINGSHGIVGMDGMTEYNMQTATDEQVSYFREWEDKLRNGGNDEEKDKGFLRACLARGRYGSSAAPTRERL